jgi:4-hydroxyphenylpyruvate dioxygenase
MQGIRRYDHVELYVGSATLSSYWHRRALGLRLVAYRGPETGCPGMRSYVLGSGELRLVVTSAHDPGQTEITDAVALHGDGVKRFALAVDDVAGAFALATHNGAFAVRPPTTEEDEHGAITRAAIRIYDDTEIVLVNRDGYRGPFAPGYVALDDPEAREPERFLGIDHIVGNVRESEMDYWSSYLQRTLGFETYLSFDRGDIATAYSGLLSKVSRSPNHAIQNPINEPYPGERVSQIDEFLHEYRGTGVQHVALATDDIVATVAALREAGVELIDVPDTYYTALERRLAGLPAAARVREDLDALRRQRILCDIEGQGYLLQTFTKPIGDRATLFYEIIQRRRGASGFGQGNFQALFEAVEAEQRRRGYWHERRAVAPRGAA